MASPGRIVLFGSGETSPSGRRVLDGLLRSRRSGPGASMVILETPAGFEPNSDWVAGQVADFVKARLAEHRPRVTVIPARRKQAEGGTDDPELLAPLWTADLIYLGAGSPTYAVRQLAGSLAWQIILARHRLGADIVLASASTLAASALTLPVYEIYKVGQDLAWSDGLDFFGDHGARFAFIPHWNNNDGGANLDTSRCFMGEARMRALLAMLPAGVTTIGIDEHTALVVDVANGSTAATARVEGNGAVTVVEAARERRIGAGSAVPIAELSGSWRPLLGGAGIDEAVWSRALAEATVLGESMAGPLTDGRPPDALLALAAERESARAARDWAAADRLRREIAAAGWELRDTPAGPELAKIQAAV